MPHEIVCQFLIGMVLKPEALRKVKVDAEQECQFLIGMVLKQFSTSCSSCFGYFVSIPHRYGTYT